MNTTSLKLPDHLKHLAGAAAKRQGVSAHAFMVEAIRVAATQAQQRAKFVADAVAARAQTVRSGKGFAADEVRNYLRAKAQGKPAPKPRAKTWRA